MFRMPVHTPQNTAHTHSTVYTVPVIHKSSECLRGCVCVCRAHLQVSAVHARSVAHVQEVLDGRLLDDDVHRHFPLEASVQQVLENVDVGENVHHDADELGEKNTKQNMNVGVIRSA